MTVPPAAPLDLTPPESLTPPAPVAPVAPERAEGLVKLEPAKTVELDLKVDAFLRIILAEQVHSEAFKTKVSGVHTLANEEIRAAASLSSRLLQQPVRAMNAGLYDAGSSLSRSLLDLRQRVEALDPSRKPHLLQPKKLLGLIPWGSHLQDYFRQYESAQSHLDAIIKALYNGQDELRKDNAAVEEEKVNAWRIMERLEEYIYLGKKIDAAISAQLEALEVSDPEKARVVREELLFYVRQKVQDLLTQLAVMVQGYLAMDMIRKNNLELIKGVDRATTTTLSALRTAVIVAQALANQKLVLDQIGALNATTGNLIAATAQLLKQQAATVHEQAAQAAVGLDQLKQAFQNIYQTMDMVASYKTQALGNLQTTVAALTQEVDQARLYLDRAREDAQVSDLAG